jgi:2-polyprenyl-3-methyl-5-hydroxy-6-metoxy-1,4-benzoquinol methylase
MRIQNKMTEIDFFDTVATKDVAEDFSFDDYEKLLRLSNCIGFKNKAILEPGCGVGRFGKILASKGNNVIGVDISPGMVKRAMSDPVDGYKAIEADLEQGNLFEPNRFDVIFCSLIVHHFPNPQKLFENFSNWLSIGGRLVLIEPNGSNPILKLSNFLSRFLRRYYSETGTINETAHTLRQYNNFLSNGRLRLLEAKTYFPPVSYRPWATFWDVLINIKQILFQVIKKILPFPFDGTILIIIANILVNGRSDQTKPLK